MASFQGTAIYCTPTQAQKISTYPYNTITATINRTNATTLRDYYDAGEAGINTAVGVLTSILTSPLGSFSVILGAVAGFATSVATELWEDRDTIFDGLATNSNGQESWKVTLKYKYVRHGSNDGAWFLQDAKVL
jgi:hypothetical protein